MILVDRLEDTLNGGFAGLYGEVVTCDTYHLRQVDFQPDVVFDIGANVGVFSRFARELFPRARIVALEPHPENVAHFKRFTRDPNLVLIEQALGLGGTVYRILGAANGAGENYRSGSLGYPLIEMEHSQRYELTGVGSVDLHTLATAYWQPGQRAVMKIDCEGGENCIWTHAPSMSVLRQMDFLAIELHFFALNAAHADAVRRVTEGALQSLEETYACTREHIHVWARRRSR